MRTRKLQVFDLAPFVTRAAELVSDPGAVRTTGFTLAASDANSLIVCTAAITVTVPAAGTLGNGFSCDILADGAAVTLNGPGATNMTLADGEIGSVFVANSKVRSAKGSTTRLD